MEAGWIVILENSSIRLPSSDPLLSLKKITFFVQNKVVVVCCFLFWITSSSLHWLGAFSTLYLVILLSPFYFCRHSPIPDWLVCWLGSISRYNSNKGRKWMKCCCFVLSFCRWQRCARSISKWLTFIIGQKQLLRLQSARKSLRDTSVFSIYNCAMRS